MRVIPQKKKKRNENEKYKTDKKEEISTAEETGLAQQAREEPSCYCCGEKHYLRECKVKHSTSKEKWLTPDYWKPPAARKASGNVQVATEVVHGFSGAQISLSQVEKKKPEEIMDSGSTVKLMKSKELVTNLRNSKKQLLMATNGGDKEINQTCMVPQVGDPG